MAAQPDRMYAAAAGYETTAHILSSVAAATTRASGELLAEWQGRGAAGFAARMNHLATATPDAAHARLAVAITLRTLATQISEAQALARQAMALDQQAATVIDHAHGTELAALQAQAAADDINSAQTMMDRANAISRSAWQTATAAFEAITGTSPSRKTAALTSAVKTEPAHQPETHERPKVSLDQIKIVTQADGRRVYSFDGGLAIAVDMPGAHQVVEGIKAYMVRFLAGHHGGLEVPAGLSAKNLWYKAAYFYIITSRRPIPRQLRDQFSTATYSSITFKDAVGMQMFGMFGGIASNGSSDENNAVGKKQIVKTNQGLGTEDLGAARELRVAEITGGRVLGEPGKEGLRIVEPNVGRTDVDVEGPNGEYIVVGGPGKSLKLDRLADKLRILRYGAGQAGVRAQAYFEDGTPKSVLRVARHWLGPQNVFTFTLKSPGD